MAFPWKTVGKYALLFAEYAMEKRFAPKMPEPVTKPEVLIPPPVPDAPAPPVPIAQPIDWKDPWVFEQYRKAPPDGMNRYPDDAEWLSDSENVGKYGRDWLVKNLRARNGVKE